MILNKGDTFKKDITLTKKGNPFDLTGQILVAILKKEWQDDEEALDVQIIENHTDAPNGKTQVKMTGLDEVWDYILYIKSIDEDEKYTLGEIPLTIK
jgi:hypothetical protein